MNTLSKNIQQNRTLVNYDDQLAGLTVPYILAQQGILLNSGGRSFKSPLNPYEKTASAYAYDDHVFDFSSGTYLSKLAVVNGLLHGTWEHPRGEVWWKCICWCFDAAGLSRPTLDPQYQKKQDALEEIYETRLELWNAASEDRRPALEYLSSRGIPPEIAEKYCGYLPKTWQPKNKESALRAGLFSVSAKLLHLDRVIIPLWHYGRIVEIYGRALDTTRIPRHVYCVKSEDPPIPETVFLINEVTGNHVCLCESIIDALSFKSHGIEALGLYGTNSLTEARLELLTQKRVEKITIVFDSEGNQSGQRGALVAGEKLFRAGIETEIVNLPIEPGCEKTDPNSFFLKHSKSDFESLPRTEYFSLRLDLAAKEATSPQAQQAAIKKLTDLASSQDPLLAKHYAGRIAKEFPRFDKRRIEGEISKAKVAVEETKQAEKGKFKPLGIAQAIESKYRIISCENRFFRYDDGFYPLLHIAELNKLIIDELNDPAINPYQLNAVQELLRTVAFRRPEELNPPHFLNLNTNALNTNTLETIPHSPDVFLTYKLDVEYNPEATCAVFLKTLAEILPDKKLQLLMAQIFGYVLTTNISQHKAFYFYGQGANGKSTILSVLLALIGSNNYSSLALGDFKQRFRLAEILGKLVNISADQSRDELLHDGLIKCVISGDPVTAEFKNQQPFSFRPHVKLLVSSNNLPETSDGTFGFFRRWIFIPFEQVFDGDGADTNRSETIIKTELSGVLNWALLGLQHLSQSGRFIEPDCTIKLKDRFRKVTNPILSFINECLAINEGSNIGDPPKALYEAYKAWAEESGLKALGKIRFYEKLELETKIERKHDERGDLFPGVQLIKF